MRTFYKPSKLKVPTEYLFPKVAAVRRWRIRVSTIRHFQHIKLSGLSKGSERGPKAIEFDALTVQLMMHIFIIKVIPIFIHSHTTKTSLFSLAYLSNFYSFFQRCSFRLLLRMSANAPHFSRVASYTTCNTKWRHNGSVCSVQRSTEHFRSIFNSGFHLSRSLPLSFCSTENASI